MNKKDILSMKISDLELSVRANNVAKSCGVVFVKDLVVLTESEFVNLPNCGRKTISEIKNILSDFDLSLGLKKEYLEEITANVEPITENQQINSLDSKKPPIPLEFGNKKLSSFGISKRAEGVLGQLSIFTIGQFLNHSNIDFQDVRNCGVKTKNEIIDLKGLLENELKAFIDGQVDAVAVPYEKLFEISLNSPNKFHHLFLESLSEGAEDKYLERSLFESFLATCLNLSIEKLKENELVVYEGRFLQFEVKTLQVIGDELGVTRERVRQLESKILKDFTKGILNYQKMILMYFEKLTAEGIDPISEDSTFFQVFHTRKRAVTFLSKVLKYEKLNKLLTSEIKLDISTRQAKLISKMILENYENNLSNDGLENVLSEDYGYSVVQSRQLVSLMINDDIAYEKNGKIILRPQTKIVAISNIAMGFRNGSPWRDLASIAKNKYRCCEGIRDEHSPDHSISGNPNLYNYGAGVYRHINFFNISDLEMSKIESEILNLLNEIKIEFIPLKFIQSKCELLQKYNTYDLIKICKDSELINIRTKSSQSLLFKNNENQESRVTLKCKVLSILNCEMEPWSKYEVAHKILKSKSEGHASFILNELKKEDKVYRFDKTRYVGHRYVDQIENIDEIKNLVSKIVVESDKIVTGSYLKLHVEKVINCSFSRFFYSSISFEMSKKSDYSWVRGYSFKEKLSDDFSLERMVGDIIVEMPNLSPEELVQKVMERVHLDRESILRALYMRNRKIKHSEDAA